MKKRFVALLGLLALAGCGDEVGRGVVANMSDPVQKEKVVDLVMLSMARSIMVFEYDNGALHVALPIGMITDSSGNYYTSIRNLCENFEAEGVRLNDIGLLNGKGTQGAFLNATRLCPALNGVSAEKAILLIDDNGSYKTELAPNFWKTDGKAFFGPFPNNPASVIARLSSTWSDPVPEIVRDRVRMAQPVYVALNQGRLIVVLPQAGITRALFDAVVTNGLCVQTGGEENGWWSVDIRDVFVMNQSLTQAMAFSGGILECQKAKELPADESERYGRERTRTVSCLEELSVCLESK